jgi:hypothetical protein
MVTVDRHETPTIVKSVARSFKGWLGSDADSAKAAEAPQIAVAPPVNKPNLPRKPRSRAAIIATEIVRATETTTSRIGCQPSAAIWAAVSSAMTRRCLHSSISRGHRLLDPSHVPELGQKLPIRPAEAVTAITPSPL